MNTRTMMTSLLALALLAIGGPGCFEPIGVPEQETRDQQATTFEVEGPSALAPSVPAEPPPGAPPLPWPADCVDNDDDGWPVCPNTPALSLDCNDSSGRFKPGAPDPCTGEDEDCDGETDEHLPDCPTSTDPSPVERPWELDTGPVWKPPLPWADGCVDADEDGWPTCREPQTYPLDCDDDNARVYPISATEFCNNVDDDCDGETDEYIGGCATSTLGGGEQEEGEDPRAARLPPEERDDE